MSRVKQALLLSFLSVLSLHTAQGALEGEEIIGGEEVKPQELGYQVTVQFFGMHLCGGAIVDERFVVTAAHCFVDGDGEFLSLPISVLADTINAGDEAPVEASVNKAYWPARYNGSFKTSDNDIVVLRLKEKLNLGPGSKLSSIALPVSTEAGLTLENSFEDEEVLVSGYGWDQIEVTRNNETGTLEEDGSSTGKLLKARAEVIGNEECQSLYKRYVIHESQVCARVTQHPAEVHQGVCSGDSGSPLVYDGSTIVGLVSYNYKGCNDNRRPAVYTRVSAFISFISNAMRDNVTQDMKSYSW